MSWKPLPVDCRIVGCERPFSFYFGLIERYWRSGNPHEAPLHRLATLARKQGAKALVIEDAAADPDVVEEIDALAASSGVKGEAEAVRLSFLTELPQGEDICSVSANCLIGTCTLINFRDAGADFFRLTYILEAVFATPKLPGAKTLLNNFINAAGAFEVKVWGRTFPIEGVCYAQQNGVTSVCAHASIRMVQRTLYPDRIAAGAASINEMLGGQAPSAGLLPQEIASILEQLTGHHVAEIDCDKRPPTEYVSILTAAADSGELALLIFKTGAPKPQSGLTNCDTLPDEGAVETSTTGEHALGENHVVVVFGYTRNSDEWHPLAIPEYSGLAASQYRAASMWVDHLVIHDDNFGPYLTLSTRALERDPTVRAEKILIVRRHPCNLSADMAETASSIWLSALPEMFSGDIDLEWLALAIRYDGAFVLRPVLLTREEYKAHVNLLVAHDGSRLDPPLATELDRLPDVLWMVEFSLPDVFTGNRAKLGEVLVDANVHEDQHLDNMIILGARLPGRLVLAHGADAPPSDDPAKKYGASVQDLTLVSHSPMFMRKEMDHLW